MEGVFRMRNRILSLAILSVVAASANAQSFSADFEAPTYSVGVLTGQNGFALGGTTITPANPWNVTNNRWFGPAASGQSAVQSYSGTGGSWNTTSQAIALGNGATGVPIISFSAQIWVDGITAASSDRYFGLQIGTSNSPTATVIGIALDLKGQLRGGYGYSTASTGFNGSSTGVLQTRSIADFVNRWVGVSVNINRTTGDVVYTFSGLGTSGGNATETFARNYSFLTGPGTGAVTHFSMVSDWVTSAGTGTAYFDNVSIEAVPEPMTMTVLALGAVAALRRRNRKS